MSSSNSPTPPPTTPVSPPPSKRKPLVLAVDDQADSLRYLELRLKSGGMDCLPCSSGIHAIDLLQDHAVDIIILDVMMPQLDGFEVCRRIKSDPHTQDIPILFLTAKMEAADKVKGLEVGGHDYLNKPVDQQELIARTRAALRVKHLQDQLKQQLRLEQEIHHLHQGMLSTHWQNTFGQLASSLAHEINNPLAAALGNIQLLCLEDGITPHFRERLTIIDDSLQRAGQKMRSLLLIAHAHRQPQGISLSRLIEDLLTLVNFKMVLNKVSISTRLDPQCHLRGIPGELARALLYLLNNAIEAVAGQPNANIMITAEKTPTHQIIRVSDNGVGIPPHHHETVFEPFFTTKPLPDHTGVGLYLARQIIQEAGGTLELQSPAKDFSTEMTLQFPTPPPLTHE